MKRAMLMQAMAVAVLTSGLVACGGGGGSNSPPPPPPNPPPPTTDPLYRVSAPTPFVNNCDGVPASGTLYASSEVEPMLAIDPRDSRHLVGNWQQDRWSNGSARGLLTGFSFDGGVTWARSSVPFSRCSGGNAGNGGDYARATDPWVSFAPDSTVHQMSLSTNGASFTATGDSAMLASRSTDGGRTWSNPVTLIRDQGATFFNDKNAMTADATDPRFVYAVWGRLQGDGSGPAWFARSINGGVTWEPARSIYDPGAGNQTIGNVIVSLPNGTLVNAFTNIIRSSGTQTSINVIRSTDRGVTWSAPIRVADSFPVGTRDPDVPANQVRDGALVLAVNNDASGNIVIAWQDSRTSGGARDGIMMSRSTDAGLTWSAPLTVNRVAPNVPAFIPSVGIRANGIIGITYFDFRSNTAATNTLLTDHWLARSSDGGATWTENRVSGPFDLAIAPNARGFFIGDYMALGVSGNTFVPFFVQTNLGDTNNRTDVFAAPQVSIAASVAKDAAGPTSVAIASPPAQFDSWAEAPPAVRARTAQLVEDVMEARIPGWKAARERLRPQ